MMTVQHYIVFSRLISVFVVSALVGDDKIKEDRVPSFDYQRLLIDDHPTRGYDPVYYFLSYKYILIAIILSVLINLASLSWKNPPLLLKRDMANSIDFRGITTSFKNFQFLKTSSRRMPLMHEVGLATSSKKPILTLKNRKKFYVSCSSNTPKPGDFPLQNWWLQKNAEVAYEFAKSLIIWILSSFHKKREFKTNLPFKVGDLLEVKASSDSVFGVVEEIGEKMTCIKGFDNIPRYLPNADFATKSVRNLTFVTVQKECLLKCCAGKEKQVDSKVQVDSLLALWGLTLSFQISCKASRYVKKMLEDIHAEITGDSDVKAHWRVSVSIGSYISDKQKFEILVACFVDAKKCSQEYLRIKSHLQMKLADRVGKYEKPTKKRIETVI